MCLSKREVALMWCACKIRAELHTELRRIGWRADQDRLMKKVRLHYMRDSCEESN